MSEFHFWLMAGTTLGALLGMYLTIMSWRNMAKALYHANRGCDSANKAYHYALESASMWHKTADERAARIVELMRENGDLRFKLTSIDIEKTARARASGDIADDEFISK